MQIHIGESLVETGMVVPERNLLVAILERAVFDYYGNDVREREAASEWLLSDSVLENEPFSFAWICLNLSLDRVDVLEAIRNLAPRESRTTQQWWSELQAA